jgi:hypothetical protein
MKKRVVVLLAICAIAGISQATLVNFDSASDLDDFYVTKEASTLNPDLDVSQNATLGTGTPVSGGIKLTGIPTGSINKDLANDVSVLYGGNAGQIILATGETLSMSLKYKNFKTNNANVPYLGVAGFSLVDTASTDWTDLSFAGGKQTIGSGLISDGISVALTKTDIEGDTARDKFLTLFNSDNTGTGTGTSVETDASGGSFQATEGNWYQTTLDITKSVTLGEFDVVASVNLLSADGTTFASTVRALSETITNLDLYNDDLVAGFSINVGKNGAAATFSNEFDDFEITGGTVTPEPATMAILALGGLFLRRRKA